MDIKQELLKLDNEVAYLLYNPHQSFTTKPTTGIGVIQKNTTVLTQVTTVNDLIDIVVTNGHPIRLCKNKTNTLGLTEADVLETEWLGFDSDDNASPQQILNILDKYSLKPYLIYSTLSDSPQHRKLRVIFRLTTPIQPTTYNYLVKTLINHLSFSKDAKLDKACKNASRLWFPGKAVEYSNDDAKYSPQTILDVCEVLNASNYSNVANYQPKQFSDISQETYSYTTKDREEYIKQLTKECRNFNFKLAFERNKLLNDFINNNGITSNLETNRKLTHLELAYIASNLMYIEGGLKMYKDALDNANKVHNNIYDKDKYVIANLMKKRRYLPWKNTHSPYKEDQDHTNILLSTRHPYGYIETIQSTKKLTLEQGEQTMKNIINKVHNLNDTDIHIIVCPTGLGKTEEILSLQNITFAVPRYNLMDEVTNRMDNKNIKYTKTIELDLKDEDNKAKLNRSYKTLKVTKSKQQLNSHYSIAKEIVQEYNQTVKQTLLPEQVDIFNLPDSPITNKEIDFNICNEYISNHRKSLSTTDTVVTTHNKAIYMDFQHKSIWFDEDPIELLLEQGYVKIEDLKCLYKIKGLDASFYELQPKLQHNCIGKCGKTVELLQDLTPGLFNLYKQISNDKKAVVDIPIDIYKLFSSHFCIIGEIMEGKTLKPVIHYIIKHSLPQNKKIVVCSATPKIEMWKHLFPNKTIHIYNDAEHIVLKGKIIQNTSYSCSRQSLKQDQVIEKITNDIKLLEKTLRSQPFTKLTFKTLTQDLNADMDIYFCNCSGLDRLKGKDIAVIGTPHLPHFCYMLYFLALNIELTINDICGISTTNQLITFNRKKCWFNTYDNPLLQSIQLELINDRLTQLIGRARALRTDATVVVYSNFPVSDTTEYRNM